MPTTTPNFGWSVPVSTDLVKDGATAIELLGDSIDTSFVDLLGGTTGQVLAKASGTDLDFTFVTPATGGIKQLISNNSTTSQTLSTTSYTDVTGASVTITPTSASSSVQISVTYPVEIQRQTNALLGYSVKLFRGATELDEFESIVMLNAGVAANNFIQMTGVLAINYKDSPATTSATTYKLQAKLTTTANLANSFIPGSNGTLNISAMEF